MRIYRSLEEIADLHGRPRAVAIGIFDGVHVGHQLIVRKAVEAAREMDGVATVLTFEPHPASVLAPKQKLQILTPLELKINLLEKEGVQEVAAIPFTPEFAQLSPEAFCRLLLMGRLAARQIVVGSNFRFGHRGAGGPADLVTYGRDHGFSVTAVQLVERRGRAVSSTRIRSLLRQGQVEAAAELLCRPHILQGLVVAGAGRGRDLGVPTANLRLHPNAAIPAHGVYFTRAIVAARPPRPSVTSVGTNPTFEKDGVVSVESHLLDFNGNLYGEHLSLEFLGRLRGQVAFPNPEALMARISEDLAAARAYFRRT